MEWEQQKDFFYKIDQLHKLCFVTFLHQSETVKTCNSFASGLFFSGSTIIVLSFDTLVAMNCSYKCDHVKTLFHILQSWYVGPGARN